MTEPRSEPEPDDWQPSSEPAPYDEHTDSPLVHQRLFEDLI